MAIAQALMHGFSATTRNGLDKRVEAIMLVIASDLLAYGCKYDGSKSMFFLVEVIHATNFS